MATVNEQITDSVTQVNTKTLGDAPAMAMGSLFTATSQALSNAGLNSTTSQQHAGITMQAATVQGVNSLGAIGSAVLGRAAEAVVEKG
ncbi:RebB family R body protein [Agarilytica rhodophyticola]|uniref:RebB family R body protein n=1 Tax=Agarilytica rhodophyticola TaxID=1737490 RepID=UPI000B345E43|nr:RebB family R body protein [Agarilytica rhodophyticola]